MKRPSLGFFTWILVATVICLAPGGDWGTRIPPSIGHLLVSQVTASPSPTSDVSSALERIRTAVDRLGGALPPSRPEELAARTGGNPRQILDYIRTYLDYEPYAGVLRGSRGALLSEGGNDLDLLLLLRDAIHAAHPQTPWRYVHAPLPANRVSARRGKKIPVPLSVEQIAQLTGLDVAEAKGSPADSDSVAELKMLGNKVTEETGFLEQTLSPILHPVPPPLSPEHWWLRAQVGKDWVDLDPVFDQGDPIHRSGTEAADLPAALYHRIGLSLVLERAEGKKFVQEVLYRQEWTTADLAGELVSVAVVPEGFAPGSLDAITKANRFQAVVSIGEKNEFSHVFDLAGSVYVSSGSGFASSGAQQLGKSIFDQLAGGPGRGSPPPAILAALRLELEIMSPGETPRVYRRWILDRLDREAQTRGDVLVLPEWTDLRSVRLALLRSYQLFPLVGPTGASMIAREASDLILDATLADTARALFDKSQAADPSRIRSISLLPQLLLSSVADVAQGGKSKEASGMLDHPRPGILLYRESLKDSKPAPILEQAIDVIASGGSSQTLLTALRYGAGLSYAESDALGGQGSVSSAIQRLVAARQSGVSFRLLRAAAEAGSLAWPSTAKARLEDQLATGFLALVPELGKGRDSSRVSWWRIDPRDGVPIATGPDGEGQAMIEGTTLLRDVSIPQVEKTMTYVACLNLAVAGGQSLTAANAECLCEFLGNNVRSGYEKWARKEAIVANFGSGLAPEVNLILSEGIKYFDKYAVHFPPKEPVQWTCKALFH